MCVLYMQDMLCVVIDDHTGSGIGGSDRMFP